MKTVVKSVILTDGTTIKKPDLSSDAISAIYKIIQEDIEKSTGKKVSSLQIGATTVMC